MLKVKVEPVEPAFYGKVSLPDNALTIAGYQVFCTEDRGKEIPGGSENIPESTKHTSDLLVGGETCLDAISDNGEQLNRTSETKCPGEGEEEEEASETLKAENGMNVYVENDVMVDNNIVEEHVVEDGMVMVAGTHDSPEMIHVPYMGTTTHDDEELVIEEGADLMVGNMHSISSDMILEESQNYVIPAHHTVLVPHEEDEDNGVVVDRMDYDMGHVQMLHEHDCYLNEEVSEVEHQHLTDSPQLPALPSTSERKKTNRSKKSPKKEKSGDLTNKKKKNLKQKNEEVTGSPTSSVVSTPRPRKRQKSNGLETPTIEGGEKKLKLSPIQSKHPTLSSLLSTQGPCTLLGPNLELSPSIDLAPTLTESTESGAQDTILLTRGAVGDVNMTSSSSLSSDSHTMSMSPLKPSSTTMSPSTVHTERASNIPQSHIESQEHPSPVPEHPVESKTQLEASPRVESDEGGMAQGSEAGANHANQTHIVYEVSTSSDHEEEEKYGSLEEGEIIEDTGSGNEMIATTPSKSNSGEANYEIEQKGTMCLISALNFNSGMQNKNMPTNAEDLNAQLEETSAAITSRMKGDQTVIVSVEEEYLDPQTEHDSSFSSAEGLGSDGVLPVSPIQEKYQTVRSSLQTKLSSKVKGSETLADRYMKEWKPTGRFQCKLCFYSCVTHNFLFRHWVLNHCSLRPYMCGHCGFQSATRDGVTRHQTAKHRGLARRIFIDNEQQELLWNKFDEMFQGSGFVTETERRAQVPVTISKCSEPAPAGVVPGHETLIVQSVPEENPIKNTILKVPQRVVIKNKAPEVIAAAVNSSDTTISMKSPNSRIFESSEEVIVSQTVVGTESGYYQKCAGVVTASAAPLCPRTNTVLVSSIQTSPSVQAPHSQVLAPKAAGIKTEQEDNHRSPQERLETEQVYKLLTADSSLHITPAVGSPVAESTSSPSTRQISIRLVPPHQASSTSASPLHSSSSTPADAVQPNRDESGMCEVSSPSAAASSKIEESFQQIKKRLMTSMPPSSSSDDQGSASVSKSND